MDFVTIKEREGGNQKKPVLEVYPDFKIVRSNDLMIRGKSFYAIWDEEKGLWVTDEYAVANLVDKEILAYETTTTGFFEIHRKLLNNFSSNTWLQFRNYMAHLTDHFVQLDENITFKNTEVRKEDFVSHRLPYDLTPGDISAWDELVSTLYDPENRAKIEWAIGALVAGDAKDIQKFLVFYGAMGTGKSTILNIIQDLFVGYFTTFVAKELTGANNAFALEAFKSNPLIAIEHDGDLSKIQDNSKLNSLVSHEWMSINEKNKPIYMARFNAMLMIGSNTAVKITDSKSGIIRRLIDIHPSGKLLSARKYQALMGQIKFEHGAIAAHCLSVYRNMGKEYYSGYRPIEMMYQTNIFFNFIEEHFDYFKSQDGVTLEQAFKMYKEFIKDSEVEYSLPRHKLREELRTYFDHFEERTGIMPDGNRYRSYFSGFNANKFKAPTGKDEASHMFALVMDETESLLDRELASFPAQYANANGTAPKLYWDDSVRVDKEGKEFVPSPDSIVSTTLADLDTTREHYTKVPTQLIVIDFDLKDKDGKKSAERNLEAASLWPSTYAEFSKSGDGIHLHYYYDGDVSELSALYDDGIEVKVYTGNSALRRRLTRCNNVPIATISSGLPLKEKKVMNEKRIEDEKHLRRLIMKGLRKEVHSGTKSNIDYIDHILKEAYASGQTYNVTDMRQSILNFALGSTNQHLAAIRVVGAMKFASEDALEAITVGENPESFTPKEQKTLNNDSEVIYDVEVFPNLFVICWKYRGAPKESIVEMINPSVRDVEKLMAMKLVGFYNRQYDNHILYGAAMGYNNEQLFNLSKSLVTDNNQNAKFGEAYGISYMDLYEVSSKKQGLKKWAIELGIHHLELGLDWDKPVPRELWAKVGEYCANDVEATDVVREHIKGDVLAREILAELSGLSMNSTTQQHASKIVFGDDRAPQDKFVYTDLSEMFPGYTFAYNEAKKKMESIYRGEEAGEGGYVYAEPGMYENVEVYDVESMHPTSIEALNLFGSEYTKNFSDIKQVRVAVKNNDYDSAKQLLGGKLAKFLNDESQAEALSYALKIVINIVYGLTSARFNNSFKDPRNVDNIVAKRGALFMINLKNEVQARGFKVVHIKTDSIKIPNPTAEIREFIFNYGNEYGYKFVHEATYERFCLVNDAVYVAKVGWAEKAKKIGTWETVGAQFQHPYVKKYLFTREPIVFEDMRESRSVQQGAMYLDYTGLNDSPTAPPMALDENDMRFVGKTGQFCPMLPGTGGGSLLRIKDGKQFAVAGTKGFFWLESEVVATNNKQADIDGAYFEKLIDEAIDQLKKYGNYEWFVS